jgi:hypothetical protein
MITKEEESGMKIQARAKTNMATTMLKKTLILREKTLWHRLQC